ncbi:threonylcarbamoyladenosine tRNA methylthiotransferase [Silurus meridionalis]|nr:threonylcarbamoyladenosine tRNA methylthiotransferase [Silurus meridionalis]
MSSACASVIDDIEDMVSSSDSAPLQLQRSSGRQSVIPRVRKRKNVAANEELQVDSVIPGTQKVWLRTWGCSHNSSDGEYMAGQLAASGYKMTDDPSDADVWLLNSCTVKNPAEDHFRNNIKKAQEQNKKVVVAGCVPQAQPRMDYLKGLSIIGVQQIDRVVEVVDEAVKGHSVRLLGLKKDNGKRLGGARLDLPKIRKNPLIEIISINTGCLNACTYCKTKHARGDLASYPIEELVERARQSFQEGVCEIWLTSEDTGAYGRDIGTDLPTLLWELVKEIPDGCMLRLGMTNPPYILEHLEEMAKILSHPRVYAFLHVPVQSASDSVLMDMKREYCCDDFTHVVDFLKDRFAYRTRHTCIPSLHVPLWPLESHSSFCTGVAARNLNNPPLLIPSLEPQVTRGWCQVPNFFHHQQNQQLCEAPALSCSGDSGQFQHRAFSPAKAMIRRFANVFIGFGEKKSICPAPQTASRIPERTDLRGAEFHAKGPRVYRMATGGKVKRSNAWQAGFCLGLDCMARIDVRVPGITIATDIICGFPGETDDDFKLTMELVRKYRFPSLFINQFYPRPGTPAAKMEQVPAHVKKQRTKELSALFHSYNPYDHKVGERQSVLVTEESFDAQYYVAHNKFYEQVLVPKKPEFKGKMIEVDIFEAGKHFLRGQPLEDSTVITPSINQPLKKGEISGLSQELKGASQNGGPAPLQLTCSSWNLDGQGLKLSVGLALLAIVVLLIFEKLQ